MNRFSFSLVALGALALLLSPAPASADEGMWTLDNFPAEAVEATYGVSIDADWLQTVQSGTVRLDGGCTGSLASPDGLVLTNNHCTWGCIRNLSDEQHNLSDTGFYAATREEERQCPGARISILQQTEEITEKVAVATEGKDEAAANEARKAELSKLEAACEESSGLKCESVSLYHGCQHWLYKYKRYDDVRLVFAPELAIAAFGGDPDNFNFPRWCLDFSFMRIYEDGKPASTPEHLTWRPEGPEAGEPVFVSGHPGSTQRLLTVAELDSLRDYQLPQQLLYYSELRGRLEQWGETGDEAARIVQQRILGYENAIKVWRNRLFSLQDDAEMAAKSAAEEELKAAVAADPELAAAYGDAWEESARATAAYRAIIDRYRFVEVGYGFRGDLLGWAQTLVRAAEERGKPNEERLREFRETALPGVEQGLTAEIPVSADYEKLQLAFGFDKMREWLGPDDPIVKQVLGNESPEGLAARLVEGTKLADATVRKALWEGGAEAIAASDDPMIALAQSIDGEARAIRERYENEVEAPLDQASEKIAKARFAVLGTGVYPDATFTLRVTYGSVKGWMERGEMVEPFTTVKRVYERATGEEPFALPASWIEKKDQIDPDTRFNYVATTDIIGGNSGSPVVDAEGRLVGLAFDGNIHSIAGAYWFDLDVNRTVNVHPAILVEALRDIYGADTVLEELGLGE